jgi:hypothetical protein
VHALENEALQTTRVFEPTGNAYKQIHKIVYVGAARLQCIETGGFVAGEEGYHSRHFCPCSQLIDELIVIFISVSDPNNKSIFHFPQDADFPDAKQLIHRERLFIQKSNAAAHEGGQEFIN